MVSSYSVLLNIPLRRSRDSGVTGATRFNLVIHFAIYLIQIPHALTCAYFGDIRTLIPELSGQHIGNIRTDNLLLIQLLELKESYYHHFDSLQILISLPPLSIQ